MSSTFECSRNDVASNVGVLAAAGLVGVTGAAWPDVAVAAIIALIFLRSAWRVLGEAIPAWRSARPLPPEVLR
jgi:Co/Zn/Cd efflux system component